MPSSNPAMSFHESIAHYRQRRQAGRARDGRGLARRGYQSQPRSTIEKPPNTFVDDPHLTLFTREAQVSLSRSTYQTRRFDKTCFHGLLNRASYIRTQRKSLLVVRTPSDTVGATSTGVVGLLIPYLLREHGVPVDHIAEVVAVAGIPLMWSFVAAPLVDLGQPRRIWVMFSAAASGLSAATAIILST